MHFIVVSSEIRQRVVYEVNDRHRAPDGLNPQALLLANTIVWRLVQEAHDDIG